MTLAICPSAIPRGAGFWMKRNAIVLGEVMGEADFVLLDWDSQKQKGDGQQHSDGLFIPKSKKCSPT